MGWPNKHLFPFFFQQRSRSNHVFSILNVPNEREFSSIRLSQIVALAPPELWYDTLPNQLVKITNSELAIPFLGLHFLLNQTLRDSGKNQNAKEREDIYKSRT